MTLSRIAIALAVAGAALWGQGPVPVTQAQTAPEIGVRLHLSCRGRTDVRGTVKGSVGGTEFEHLCDSSSRVKRSDISALGGPDTIPWDVTLTVLDTTCRSEGTGLPVHLSCRAISDPEISVGFEMSPQPRLRSPLAAEGGRGL